MKNALKLSLVLGVAGLALPAFAKGKSKTAAHHCMKDGQEVAGVASSKACKKEGGKWEKMKSGQAAGTTTPAPTPAPGEGGGADTP